MAKTKLLCVQFNLKWLLRAHTPLFAILGRCPTKNKTTSFQISTLLFFYVPFHLTLTFFFRFKTLTITFRLCLCHSEVVSIKH